MKPENCARISHSYGILLYFNCKFRCLILFVACLTHPAFNLFLFTHNFVSTINILKFFFASNLFYYSTSGQFFEEWQWIVRQILLPKYLSPPVMFVHLNALICTTGNVKLGQWGEDRTSIP